MTMIHSVVDRVGVHTTHCCDKHGCKYSDKRCPVEKGRAKQEHPCEECGARSLQDGGYYDETMVWHPPITEILVRVAREVGLSGNGHLSPETLRTLWDAATAIGI